MKFYILLWFILCITTANAQQCIPTDTLSNAYTATLSKSYPSRNKLFLAELKQTTTDRKLLKHFEETFKDIFEGVNEEVKDGQMIYIPAISTLLEKILAEIKAKNPSIPSDVQVLLVRENSPNAITMGDNTIFVNMGLLAYLENEDQVAGVISHEVGHLLMLHALKALKYGFEFDKGNTANVKAIRGIENKKSDRAFELLKDSMYKGRKIKRAHEMQADSVGYILHKNTQYNKTDFLKALKNIELYDSIPPGILAAETYKRFFNLPGQSFKDKWLQAEDFSSYNYKSFTPKLDEDSVSTHPETHERIKYLETLFPELIQNSSDTQKRDAGTYTAIKAIAAKNRIANLYFNERYGGVIYEALLKLQETPEDLCHKQWLGKGFKKIYEARRDYQLNRYLNRVDPKNQSESYIRFLNFMWNLSLDEIKNISDYYSVK